MKKLLTAMAAAAVIAAGAFAEVTFGTWMRVQAAMVASDGNDTYAGMQNSWGGGARTGRVDINGSDEDGKAGFSTQIFLTVGDSSVGFDRIAFWVQPISQVRVNIGKFDSPDTWLRGDFCYGQWNWIRAKGSWIDGGDEFGGEGFTFSGQTIGQGLMVQIWPIDGLSIVVGVPLDPEGISSGNSRSEYDSNGKVKTESDGSAKVVASNTGTTDGLKATYISSQVAVAYKIEPINSTIKVQYCGSNADSSKEAGGSLEDGTSIGAIEVAFDFGLVENLWVTAGFRYRIMDGDLQSSWKKDTMKVALGVSYGLGNLIGWDPGFTIYLAGAMAMYNGWDDIGTAKYERDPIWQFGVGVDFGIIDNLTLQADVRYKSETKENLGSDKSVGLENDCVSFLIGVLYNVSSNGEIGIGFQGATNGQGLGTDKNWSSDLAYEDKFAWAIPIRIGVWF